MVLQTVIENNVWIIISPIMNNSKKDASSENIIYKPKLTRRFFWPITYLVQLTVSGKLLRKTAWTFCGIGI